VFFCTKKQQRLSRSISKRKSSLSNFAINLGQEFETLRARHFSSSAMSVVVLTEVPWRSWIRTMCHNAIRRRRMRWLR
jgi:hypothetical protein